MKQMFTDTEMIDILYDFHCKFFRVIRIQNIRCLRFAATPTSTDLDMRTSHRVLQKLFYLVSNYIYGQTQNENG